MFRKMASNSEEIGRALKGVLENIQKAVDARPKVCWMILVSPHKYAFFIS